MNIECPDENQSEAFEVFGKLQSQLEKVLKDEEKLIEKRLE